MIEGDNHTKNKNNRIHIHDKTFKFLIGTLIIHMYFSVSFIHF